MPFLKPNTKYIKLNCRFDPKPAIYNLYPSVIVTDKTGRFYDTKKRPLF